MDLDGNRENREEGIGGIAWKLNIVTRDNLRIDHLFLAKM